VRRADIAFATTFPSPCGTPQLSNTMGEKSMPIRTQESALSRHFCSSLCFEKVAGLPRRSLPATGFGWTIVRSTARSRLPSHACSKMSAGRRPFPATPTRAHVELYPWTG